MGNDVQELIEVLSTMLREARSVPLSSDKCMIERDKALDMLDSIKAQLPSEMAEARRLVDARSEFIANAKREAENIRHAAEERAKQMVNEQEIYRTAREKSAELMEKTQKSTAELKRSANEYIDEMLRRTEEAISRTLEDTRQSRAGFRRAVGSAGKESEVTEDIDE
ncbi:MAG: hypothetical protein IK082_10740 [Oscillospiraceae bacterium]|nr:hypothetical protein [Oscillospiraceae bacterium]